MEASLHGFTKDVISLHLSDSPSPVDWLWPLTRQQGSSITTNHWALPGGHCGSGLSREWEAPSGGGGGGGEEAPAATCTLQRPYIRETMHSVLNL